jgi:hypothetical protein
MTESTRKPVFWRSLGGLLAACVAFALVLCLANVVLYLLNWIRNTEDNWLETIFRELASPAAGAYAAMVVTNKLFRTYSRPFVFFGFTALMIAFTAASLTLMLVVWSSGRFSYYDLIMQGITAPITIAAAYYAYRNEMGETDRSQTKP